VVGVGGIMNARDAVEFFIAGATAVQVGTANFVNPRATIEIVEGIEQFLLEQNLNHVNEIIGSLEI
jgi:dihydroorotate dehydrogenase (NAD+) catalytic subunit